MNIVIIYCCISILMWMSAIVVFYKLKKDALHIGILFILLYILNYHLKMIATKLGIAVINSNVFGDDAQILALILSDISAVCFTIPLLLTQTKMVPVHESTISLQKGIFTKNQAKITIVFFILMMLLLYGAANGSRSFMTMMSVTLMKQRQASLANMRIGSGFSSLLSLLATICQYIVIRTYIFHWKKLNFIWKWFLILFLIFIMWYSYAMEFSKQTTLTPILVIIVLYNISSLYFAKRKQLRLKHVVVLGGLGILAVAFIGYLRSFTKIFSMQMLLHSMFRQFFNAFDAPDNLTAIISRMNNIWFGDLHLKPIFLNSMIVFIPRSLWPGKPLLQGQMYIMSFYLQERYTGPLGEGISSSIPGELIVSGGIGCMIIGSFLMGCFYSFLYKKAHTSNATILHHIVYAYAIVQLNAFCRSGTAVISGILFTMIWMKLLCTCYKNLFNASYKLKIKDSSILAAKKEDIIYVRH